MAREYIPKRYDKRNGPSPDEVDDKYHFNGKSVSAEHNAQSYFYRELKPVRKLDMDKKTALKRGFFARNIDHELCLVALELFGGRLPKDGDTPHRLCHGNPAIWNMRRTKAGTLDQKCKKIMHHFQAIEVVQMFVTKFRGAQIEDHVKFTIMAMTGIAL